MKEIPVTAGNWFFAPDARLRWLAVQSILMSVNSQFKFQDLYLGGMADLVVAWQKNNFDSLKLEQVFLANRLSVMWNSQRDMYLQSKPLWPKILSNDVVPVGQLVANMLRGQSQRAAIASSQRHALHLRKAFVDLENTVPKSKLNQIKMPRSMTSISDDVIRARLVRFKAVLPYVYFEYQRIEAKSWRTASGDDRFFVADPQFFNSFAREIWDSLISKDRVRFRGGVRPILLNFRDLLYETNIPID